MMIWRQNYSRPTRQESSAENNFKYIENLKNNASYENTNYLKKEIIRHRVKMNLFRYFNWNWTNYTTFPIAFLYFYTQ